MQAVVGRHKHVYCSSGNNYISKTISENCCIAQQKRKTLFHAENSQVFVKLQLKKLKSEVLKPKRIFCLLHMIASSAAVDVDDKKGFTPYKKLVFLGLGENVELGQKILGNKIFRRYRTSLSVFISVM